MMGGYGAPDMYYGQQMYYHPSYMPYFGYDAQMSYPGVRRHGSGWWGEIGLLLCFVRCRALGIL
jgi:hypothetical protein